MNILFLTLLEMDVSSKQGGLYTDLVKEFLKNGHYIYAINPNISPDPASKSNSKNIIKQDKLTLVNLNVKNHLLNGPIKKGVHRLLIGRKYLFAIKKFFEHIKFDLVLYSTPPITFNAIIKYLKKKDQTKSYLMLKDIFPQNALDLKMLHTTGLSGFIYRYFLKIEKDLYNISDYIGCMSPANVEYLKKNYQLNHKTVEILPNTITPSPPIEKHPQLINTIRQQYGLPLDKKILVYGGNLGKPQGIDFLNKCCMECNNDSFYFVIAGSGTETYKIQEMVSKNTKGNVNFLGNLPMAEFERLLLACDLGLIFLDHRFTIPNFPSRLLSYMQAQLPILAVTDPVTDLGRIIVDSKLGYWCESGQIDHFNQTLNRVILENNLPSIGKNARQFLEKNYTSTHAYSIIMKHFD